MLKKTTNNILKYNLKNSLILKYYYKNIILKSIFQNRNIQNKKRLLAFFFFSKKSLNNKIKNCCLETGRQKGVVKSLSLSRQKINFLSKSGLLNNFKVKSW